MEDFKANGEKLEHRIVSCDFKDEDCVSANIDSAKLQKLKRGCSFVLLFKIDNGWIDEVTFGLSKAREKVGLFLETAGVVINADDSDIDAGVDKFTFGEFDEFAANAS